MRRTLVALVVALTLVALPVAAQAPTEQPLAEQLPSRDVTC